LSIQEAKKAMVMDRVIRGEMTAAEGAARLKMSTKMKKQNEIESVKMTHNQQRAALQRQIWQIANNVRGAVDGWGFKHYVLDTLFYRFISENFASYAD